MKRGKFRTYFCVLSWGALDAFDCRFVFRAGSSSRQPERACQRRKLQRLRRQQLQRQRRNCRLISRRRARIRRRRSGRIRRAPILVSGRRPPATARGISRRNCRFKTFTIGWRTTFISINFVWALVAGFLVMFMQAGFMLVETGLCRAKNASHTAAMNLMIYPLGGFGVLGLRLRYRMGQLVERSRASRLVRVAWSRPVCANGGWGFGAAVDAAGKATGAFTYGIIGTTGWFLNGAVE